MPAMCYLVFVILGALALVIQFFVEKGRLRKLLLAVSLASFIGLGFIGYSDGVKLMQLQKELTFKEEYPDSHGLYQSGKIVARFQDGQLPIIKTSTVIFPMLYDFIGFEPTTTIMIFKDMVVHLQLLSSGKYQNSFVTNGLTAGVKSLSDVVFTIMN